MKLNYRDKVILGILLAVVILIAGFVGLVKPKNASIDEHKATLADMEVQRDEVQQKIDQIVPLTNKINDTYSDTNKLVGDFCDYDSIYLTTNLDQFLQDYANECELKVTKLEVSEMSSEDIEYYYFTTEVEGEELFASADVNGSSAAALEQINAESNNLSDRNVEKVLKAQYAVTVTGTRENLWKYMAAIEEQDEAVIINSVTIADYSFGQNDDTNTGATIGEELEEGESSIDMVISCYSVYEMGKPNTDAD